ncbi:MAG: hypothetical protein Q8S17_05225 [Humidesulfovibrio sp.]|nr:hypothetical protein [Humidesulfovibrio sp.]
MPRRAAPKFLPLPALSRALYALCVLFVLALALPALAAPESSELRLPEPRLPENKHVLSQKAQELRQEGDLVPYQPPHAVLNSLFIADEDAPKGVYGPISAYVRTRACPTAWLIDKGELQRVRELAARKNVVPYEFSLTLEEDCPGQVTHAVFVTAPGSTPEAWLQWRSQFHGRKAAGHYSAALAGLKKAEAAGLALTGELRFLSVNGQLVTRNLEDVLREEGRLAPVFDLDKGARTAR